MFEDEAGCFDQCKSLPERFFRFGVILTKAGLMVVGEKANNSGKVVKYKTNTSRANAKGSRASP